MSSPHDTTTERPNDRPPERSGRNRRELLAWGAVAAGLAASYGTLAAFVGRFLYPEPTDRSWFFVARTSELQPGEARLFRTPRGEPVNVTRRGVAAAAAASGEGGDGSDFAALSSTCPHLGCQVHWEAHNNRFFCPCHNGVFDPDGVATAGPPAEAGQSLLRYPVRDDRGMLFIQLPREELAAFSALHGASLRRPRLEPMQASQATAGACLAPAAQTRAETSTTRLGRPSGRPRAANLSGTRRA
ncbi:MAG: ubiquinol-cytochrome c reductase iron-sulfur subunit [Acidobacteria bacterium]|nr:MAG: ubiquinol-cytochrome c reductase iron-sulfur subunit [Acidobacteriota bacterium]REK07749.1 MAG: ubiquinol-cytochrome c reductase iron-sulfur subunit [Acidobacteriota bacterium]